MDLRKLEHVVALAETLHFGRACARVNLSQSAFSRSLQSLEEELGATLFRRDAHGVEPTPAGTVVIGRARRMLFEAKQIRDDLQQLQNGALGSVDIGLGATPAALLGSSLLTLGGGLPAGSRIAIRQGPASALLQMLYSSEIDVMCADIAPLDTVSDRAQLEIEELPQWPIGLFVRAGHPLAGQQTVSRQEVIQFQFASTQLSPFALALLQKEFATPDGFARAISIESDSFSDMIQATLQTDLVIVASRSVFVQQIASGELRELALEPPVESRARFGLVKLRRRQLPPLAEKVASLVRESFERYAREAVAPLRTD
ncbi:LysR family transcriptional regulator [Paraburkholderia sp. BCC1886]|uniref:LysR family transcriptional regulator n=1 Tax=Paraburkholderia sp. BCC1886 TaxID=2562670 RepID=UPI001183A033|nr:LysR family transcriptional regulator [Paraburkholderia sp. BCC1886]